MNRVEPSVNRINSESVLDLLVRMVERRFGLRVQDSLKGAIASAAQRLVIEGTVQNLSEVLHRLVTGPAEDVAVVELKQAVTISETYFFRTPEQLASLRSQVEQLIVLPKRSRGTKYLRAWSAGCATGEEAYTLAVILRELAPDFSVQVIGSDMNAGSLRVAKAGVYYQRSLRGLNPEQQSWLRRHGEGWEVVPAIRQLVTFVEHNLITDPAPSPERGLLSFDVVFCRNVLIYIDESKIPNLMKRLTATAAPVSVLGLSPAEYMAAPYAVGFSSVAHGLFVRRGPPAQAAPLAPVAPAPLPATLLEPRRPSAFDAPRPQAQPTPSASASPEQMLQRAREAADRGNLVEARELAEMVLAHQADRAYAWYLLALVHSASGQLAQAIDAFTRALFLDRDMVGAELGLAQVLARERGPRHARKHFERALRLLSERPSEATVEELGVTVATAKAVAAGALEDEGVGR